ncbi:Bax inhibitor-1/YccA family protein [Desulfothermus okinawensis JCM 13304]
MSELRAYTTTQAATNVFLRGVYLWMSIGLMITAYISYLISSSPTLISIFLQNQLLFIGIIIGEIVLVVTISGAISRLSASMATILFIVYSGLNGITLSTIFLIYTKASIMKTFFVCSGMFGAMSIYGYTTSKDLTSWRSFLFMGLIGVIIASVVNMFFHSTQMEFVISVIGILVFIGLTAYDTQKLKQMGQNAPLDKKSTLQKGTILGALTLYLDFINLFLLLLRFFGSGRD